MRTIVPRLSGLAVIAAVSAQAAPLAPKEATPPELAGAPTIELIREGCGHGWHRHHWRDQWGYWHWGRCVPNW
jgi:hypothetical protein